MESNSFTLSFIFCWLVPTAVQTTTPLLKQFPGTGIDKRGELFGGGGGLSLDIAMQPRFLFWFLFFFWRGYAKLVGTAEAHMPFFVLPNRILPAHCTRIEFPDIALLFCIVLLLPAMITQGTGSLLEGMGGMNLLGDAAQQQPASAGGGGLFGGMEMSGQAPARQQPSGGGGLFGGMEMSGSTQAPAIPQASGGGGLFGGMEMAGSTHAPAGSGPGLFGGMAMAGSSQVPATQHSAGGGGLFGGMDMSGQLPMTTTQAPASSNSLLGLFDTPSTTAAPLTTAATTM